MDIRLALMTGNDIPIPECQLVLHQPTLEEIAFIGEEDFFKAVQCLTLHKSMFVEDENVLDDITNFQIFMTMMTEKETKDKKEAVKQFFLIAFPQSKVIFSPRSLIVQQNDNTITIDEENFEYLQEVMRKAFCVDNTSQDQQALNPANAAAKAIADKIMRGRQRVAEQKNTVNVSIFSQYLSTISVGLQLSVIELKKYTMYQVFDIMERYSLFINWDIDLRSRLAGAKPDSQPENWMKNIH